MNEGAFLQNQQSGNSTAHHRGWPMATEEAPPAIMLRTLPNLSMEKLFKRSERAAMALACFLLRHFGMPRMRRFLPQLPRP